MTSDTEEIPAQSYALRQHAGIECLLAVAAEQAAVHATAVLPALPESTGPADGDQLAALEAEISAGIVPALSPRRNMSAKRMRGWFGRRVLGVPLAAAAVVVVAVAGGGGTALALTSVLSQPAGTVYACVTAKGAATLETKAVKCPSGATLWHWSVTGPAGKTGAAGQAGPKGASGEQGPAGPAGPQGPAGTYTPVTVTVVTAVSNRDDSGNHGNWATDAYTRSVTVIRHSEVPASNCPSGAVKCWFYTATLADSGTFTTDAAAKSPNAGTSINGTVMGTLSGGSDIEFYASSDTPSAAGVPGTVTGDSPSTTNWVNQFFAAGTLISTPNLTDWSWTYVAPKTCEKWVDAYNNGDGGQSGDGDITGINACTS